MAFLAPFWLLSRIARTCTPRLCAASKASAMGADVNEYACTRISDFAPSSSRTMASVHPLLGLKQTWVGVSPSISSEATELKPKSRLKTRVKARKALRALLVCMPLANRNPVPGYRPEGSKSLHVERAGDG